MRYQKDQAGFSIHRSMGQIHSAASIRQAQSLIPISRGGLAGVSHQAARRISGAPFRFPVCPMMEKPGA